MASHNEQSSLIAPALLLLASVAGFILCNSPFSSHYIELLNTKIQIAVGSKDLFNKSFLLLVNDGLMAIFFLFIGLELKREIVVGELSNVRKALLPIFAAVGGMLIPALIYFSLNPTGEASNGWGIPMATDIAFALGILAVLGSRVPASLKVLLAAIAIVDDLGAILVIAIFYTAQIDLTSLALAAAFLGACIVANRLGCMKVSIFMMLGIPLWYFMLKSGVHATIAGVMLAMTIPLSAKGKNTAKLLEEILQNDASPTDSPAVFLEKSLLKWIGYLVIPVFAFCNSGVVLGSIQFGAVSLGVIFGLVFGKPIGIVGAAYVSKALKLSALPTGVNLLQITGIGFIAGIGFTMSLFISSLAFSDPALNNESKFAVLLASLIAGSFGTFLMLFKKRA